MRIAGPRSTVVMSGVDTPARFEWSPHYFKEINLVGSNAFGVEEWNGVRKHAMRALLRSRSAPKQIDVTPIITHRFALDDYKEAFRTTHNQGETGAVKVLFDFRKVIQRRAREGRDAPERDQGLRSVTLTPSGSPVEVSLLLPRTRGRFSRNAATASAWSAVR